MKARWFTVTAIAVLMAALTPLTAQGAVRMQDPDDVSLETIDIKSAVVKVHDVPNERFLAFIIESYEPFDCEDLSGTRRSGQSLGFVSDFPSTPETHDTRFRIRCDDADNLYWTFRFVQHDWTVGPFYKYIRRPSDTTVKVLLSTDMYLGDGAEIPARWKVVSTRRVDSKIAEIDTAPDRGWQDFGSQGSF